MNKQRGARGGLWRGLGEVVAMGAVVLAAGMGGPALAQSADRSLVVPNLPLEYDRGRNIGVLDRPRPEYEASGIGLGGFVLHPKMDAGVELSDNVYQTPEKTGDVAFTIAPSARLISNWGRHSLEVTGGGDLHRYVNETRRNMNGWQVGADGRYDIANGSAINASISTQRAAEPPTSASYPSGAAEVSQYQMVRAQVAPNYTVGRLKLQTGYTFTALAFDQVHNFSGALLDQRFRNSQSHSGSVRAEYAITPDTSLFVQADYDNVSYMHPISGNIPNRDSQTYTVLGGASFDLSALLRGAVGVGYTARDYHASIYPQVAGLAAELKVDWFPDALTTVGLTGRRIVQDAVIANLGGLVNTSVALRVDHEFLRNLLFDVQGAYEYDAFQNSSATINIVRAGGGVRYLVNRSLSFGLTIEHDSRSPQSVPGVSSFAETRGVLNVTVQQ